MEPDWILYFLTGNWYLVSKQVVEKQGTTAYAIVMTELSNMFTHLNITVFETHFIIRLVRLLVNKVFKDLFI